MLRNIDFKSNQIIIEFGAGNGCITETILEKMPKTNTLHVFELNDKFYQLCQQKFNRFPNIKIHNENALEFEKVIELKADEKVDYVISSLPLTLLKKEDINTLMRRVKKRLNPNGYFIQYQYSLDKLSYFKKQFTYVDLSCTLINLPPAFVYTCR